MIVTITDPPYVFQRDVWLLFPWIVVDYLWIVWYLQGLLSP